MNRALEPGTAPRYRLFWGGQIAAATFFGTIVAGTAALALNYHRLGRDKAAALSIAVGTSLVALLLAAVQTGVMQRVAIGAATLVGTFAIVYVTDSLQGEALADHVDAGGESESNVIVVGLVFAGLAQSVFLAFLISLIAG